MGPAARDSHTSPSPRLPDVHRQFVDSADITLSDRSTCAALVHVRGAGALNLHSQRQNDHRGLFGGGRSGAPQYL